MSDHPSTPGGTAPHVLVTDVGAPALSPEERHHLERVRRLRDDDLLSVTDGAGSWRWCRFGAQLRVEGPTHLEPPPSPPLGVAFALVKGEKPELVVQKLTELGIDHIRPFIADRSIVRWDADRADRNLERLRRVAVEASMQSRRVWFPTVHAVVPFAEVAALPGVGRADRDGGTPSLVVPTILIGPEGGWSDDERSALMPVVGLGDLVLRAETAAITAGALLGALRSGLLHGDHR